VVLNLRKIQCTFFRWLHCWLFGCFVSLRPRKRAFVQ
jgi:hypothetical protein